MTWQQVFEELGSEVALRHELVAAGATGSGLTSAVKGGYLVRVRRDHYALPETFKGLLEAVRVGGRLDCVSALHARGVFAFEHKYTHIRMDRAASRSRSPATRHAPLTRENRYGARLHWLPLLEEAAETTVSVVDALAQATRCQHPWHAVASLDNAVFQRLIDGEGLATVFSSLPSRLHGLRALIDGRAESGAESVLRMIVREADLHCELQVPVDGVGRVDMIVEGCLVVEADSRLAHDGWKAHIRDRGRDLELARRGFMSIRPTYQHIMFSPAGVKEAVLRLLEGNRNFRSTIL
jgi:very-short-patch-repair endonuclease